MIEKYEQYLNYLNPKFANYFEQQKPYIYCKEGCSICCETGLYPHSKLEFEYLMIGLNSLPEDKKQQVQDNIKQIKIDRQNITDGKGYYKCPFLLNKSCSIYNYRSMICRTYGLLHFSYDENNKEKFNIPACVANGLNYNQVYDNEKETISAEMYAASGIQEEPLSYNISLKLLLDNSYTQDLGIEFGENKSLVDWF